MKKTLFLFCLLAGLFVVPVSGMALAADAEVTPGPEVILTDSADELGSSSEPVQESVSEWELKLLEEVKAVRNRLDLLYFILFACLAWFFAYRMFQGV